jgi:DNA-binding response OmpR family regulator
MDDLNAKDTILIFDDEQIVLDVDTLMVKKLGYKALQATNGAEACQVFRNNIDDIGLVVLDMILPDESGSETCKRLKDIRPDVEVLHTSGLGKAPNGDNLECGCDVFLSKPFRIEDLSNKIKVLFKCNDQDLIFHFSKPR